MDSTNTRTQEHTTKKNKYNMKKSERKLLNQFINDKELSQEEKDIIVGTTLGDSHIRRYSLTSLVSLSFGYANQIYANFVLANLKNLCNYIVPREYQNFDLRYKKVRFSYVFSVRGMPSLIPFANLFTKLIIKNGKQSFLKIIPGYNVIYELLTPRALAFWLMDDAHKNQRGGITLCTDSFSLIEVLRLIRVLKFKFNINCTIHKKKKSKKSEIKNRFYYRIYIRSCSLPVVFSLVYNYFCPAMLFKIQFKNKIPLSQTKKNVKAREDRKAIKDWQLVHGPNTFPPKISRVYSTNPRAVKARLARHALKKNQVESKLEETSEE